MARLSHHFGTSHHVLYAEAAAGRSSSKYVFLKNSQYPEENTRAGVFF